MLLLIYQTTWPHIQEDHNLHTAAQYQASHDPAADDNEEYTQYTKYMPILPEKYKSRCHVQFLHILNNAISCAYKARTDLTAWGERPCGSGGPQIYRTLIHY